jgi:hypothetical protein
MPFIQRWLGLASFWCRRVPNSAGKPRPACMTVEALEDRLTPSGNPLNISVGNISLSGQESTLLNVVNEFPIAIPPISLPPGWNTGQPPLPIPGNGIVTVHRFLESEQEARKVA